MKSAKSAARRKSKPAELAALERALTNSVLRTLAAQLRVMSPHHAKSALAAPSLRRLLGAHGLRLIRVSK
ncbi:MAG TPA: hypothetical protein VGI10_04365 [Polyangiaceae bacterium]|jgi:hypothetical protein